MLWSGRPLDRRSCKAAINQQPRHIYEFGSFRLDAAEHILLRDGKAIPLTPKAFVLLLALVERHGHLLEKDELMKKVWPDTFVEEANLSSNISLIRKALGDGENGQRYIETVQKRGYRFVAGVREMGAEQAEINEAEARHTEGETLREPLTSKVYRHRKCALLALAALIIAIGGVVPVDLLRPAQLGDGVFVPALLQKAVGDLSMRPDVSSPAFSLVIERAGAMLSCKYSICISFEDLAIEKQTVFFRQRLFSL